MNISKKIDFRKVGVEDECSKFNDKKNVFDICSPHALVQLIGYIKFFYNGAPVFFRGQTSDFPNIAPSLLRSEQKDKKTGLPYKLCLKSVKNRLKHLNKYIYDLIEKKVFMPSTSVIAYEPLLQHYGIRTTWLDLVDNIWTALWFASHTAHTSGSEKQYIHYETSNKDFSYIYVLFFGHMKRTLHKCTKERIQRLCEKEGNMSKSIEEPTYGFFETNDYTLIDLRYMSPSLYKRPHSQHAILVRRSAFSSNEDINYDDARICTLRIETQCALKWLGNGILSDVHFMFPPPKYDPGYRRFLEKRIDHPAFLGSIQHIGA